MTDIKALLHKAREITEAATPAPWIAVDGGIDYQIPNGLQVKLIVDPLLLAKHVNLLAPVAWRALILPLLDVAEAAAQMPGMLAVIYELDGSDEPCLDVLNEALARLAEVRL